MGQAPFSIKDCALVAIATGVRAYNLREFRDALLQVHPGCIYHHFWGRLLQAKFDEPEYINDFAAWASYGLNEKALAEQLSVIDPTAFEDVESLRQEIVEVVERRLDASEMVPWARSDRRFHFIRSQIAIFDTGKSVNTPAELARALPYFTEGNIFYHFIDSRRRTEDGTDDFTNWFSGFEENYEDLCLKVAKIDPYFSSLKTIRGRLADICGEYFEVSK